ncbi:MAG: hypothetical protein DRP74_05275 [Candidatus Omnitrophota bacterium]|nr:MAG: hypothetical protein DRP74_05275 [Candidatus Omnitrophota bacterium]
MTGIKNKTLEKIEEKMEIMDKNSLRYQVLDCTENFKSSWIALGRALYSVYKDKLYKEWGYASFDTYIEREIGIKKQTSMKLLRSYYFLEKEEPEYLQKDYADSQNAVSLPSYEPVDILRKAKNKKLDTLDYLHLKKRILDEGQEASIVRRDLTEIIRQREELDPEEARQKRKIATAGGFWVCSKQ